jgi:hemerythrin
MAFIDWTNDLSVGIDELDSQHKQWISIINELHEAMKTGKTGTVMADVLKKMESYISFHFSSEEKVLSSRGFPEYSSHKLIHDRYAANMKKLSTEYFNGKMLMSLDVMNSLKEWLVSHIMGQDKKYAEYFKKSGK